jgi:peptidoglycan/LPS O-acetylase OafA/YrhL
MTAAHVYVRVSDNVTERMRSALRVACPAALVLLLCLMYAAGLPVATAHGAWWGESTPLSIAVPLTFGVFLITLPFLPAWGQWVASNRIARWIGSISYGTFLFHFLVIWLVLRIVDIPRNGAPSSMLELTVLVLPITLTLAWLATRYIEDPLRLRAQRLAARSQRSPVIEPEPVEPAPAGAIAPRAEPEPASSAVH